MDDAPLILTAQLPPDLHREFTDLRRRHFPPERNYLEAHVTLFHALPAHCEAELLEQCKQIGSTYAPVPGSIQGLMSLGKGTAVRLASPGILHLRELLAERFHGMLTAQDRHTPRLHVTIQNKVTTQEARALFSALEPTIEWRDFVFRGLALFRYRGGPWEPVRDFAFRGKQKA